MEIERKYDVSPDHALPALHEVPGVTSTASDEQWLEAMYYDTPELTLTSARNTLRRRTGGDDAGWHLKRPDRDGEREEVRVPLGRATRTVPKVLRGQVRAIVRDRSLAPVAQLSTHRRVHRLLDDDGAVLAEFRDDAVTAQALGGPDANDPAPMAWREWDVELATGDRALLKTLEERITGAGGVPATGSSKLARALQGRLPAVAHEEPESPSPKGSAGGVVLTYLRTHVSELISQDPLVRGDRPDSVHKMRVATRRLRSTLGTFRPLFDRNRTEPLRAELKWLADLLGAARDAEVKRDRLRTMIEEQPAELVVGPIKRRVTREQNEKYRSAHAGVTSALDSGRYLRLLDALDTLVTDPPWTDQAPRRAEDALPGLVRQRFTKMRRRLRSVDHAATSGERDHQLHEARKDAKKARYAAEALRPTAGKPAKKFATGMESMQDLLGDHHDSVVVRDLLRRAAEAAHSAGEPTFTYGRLHALEQAHAQALEHAFAGVWKKASAKRRRQWLQD